MWEKQNDAYIANSQTQSQKFQDFYLAYQENNKKVGEFYNTNLYKQYFGYDLNSSSNRELEFQAVAKL